MSEQTNPILPEERKPVAENHRSDMNSNLITAGWNECRKQTLKNLASEEVVERVTEKLFREQYVPLYDKNKPISEMTPYERARFKEVQFNVRAIVDELRK